MELTDNRLFFKSHTLSTCEDIKQILNNIIVLDKKSKTRENTLKICSNERNPYRPFNIPSRPYSFSEMVKAQYLLDLLDLLEIIKYRKYIVNARFVLRKCIYCGFEIQNCLSSIMPFKTSGDNPSICDTLHIEDKLSLGTIEKKFNSYSEKLHSDPTSIREYFTKYLTEHYEACNLSTPFYKIYQSIQRPDSKKANRDYQPRYYLPLNQVPEFIFAFIFNDGRDFSSWKLETRLPRFRESNRRSKEAYELILEKAQALCPNNFESDVGIIVHRHRLNQMFLFDKLAMINKYYNLYTSDPFLDCITKTLRLKYQEALHLKDILNEIIFKDKSFIKDILCSPFLDSLLIFDINYQYILLTLFSELGEQNSLQGLLNLIKETKKQAQKISDISLASEHSIFSKELESVGYLSISEIEKYIISILRVNPFYKKYFSIENFSVVNNFITESLPFSFSTIEPIISL